MMIDLEYLTEEDVRRIRLVSQALKWDPERVIKTPFTSLILELACKVVELQTHKDHQKHLLESIERFLEENKNG